MNLKQRNVLSTSELDHVRQDKTEHQIQLRLLGHVSLELFPGEQQNISGKVGELLGYLALFAPEGKPVTRTKLAGILWEHNPESKARRSLTKALYQLRQSFGSKQDYIIGEDHYLSISKLSTDVEHFERLAQSADPDDWESALQLYRGRLLEDVENDWCRFQRNQYVHTYTDLLHRICKELIEHKQYSRAIGYAHRWITAEPYNEQACTHLMKLYAHCGQYTSALWQFKQFKQFLFQELEVEPSQKLHALKQAIQLDYESTQAELKEDTKPWVGRKKERSQLLRLAQRVQQGKGLLLLLEGEHGAGKTRLLKSVASSCEWRNISVRYGNCSSHDSSTLYSPLDKAFEDRLNTPNIQYIRTQLESEECDMLSFVFPVFGRIDKVRTGPKRLHDALSEFLRIESQKKALLLILDSVHQAQSSFWKLLLKLAPILELYPIFLILSYNPKKLRKHAENWNQLQELELQLAPERLVLSGLSENESLHLAQELGYTPSDQEWKQLYSQTKGNPFKLQEGIRCLAQGGSLSLEPHNIHKLQKLSSSARSSLDLASVLGQSFPYGEWQSMSQDDLLSCTKELVEAGFLEETQEGYAFSSILLQQHIYEQIGTREREQYHLAIAMFLKRDQNNPQRQAWHFSQCRKWVESIHAYRLSIQKAQQRQAYASALSFTQAALRLCKKVDQPELEWDLHFKSLFFYGGLQNTPETEKTIAHMEQLLPRLQGDGVRKGLVHMLKGECLSAKGQLDSAIEWMHQAIDLFREEEEKERERKGLNNISRVYRKAGAFEKALECLHDALSIPGGDAFSNVVIKNGIAGIHMSTFAFTSAEKILDELLKETDTPSFEWIQSSLYNNISNICNWTGRLGRAVRCVEKALPLVELTQSTRSRFFTDLSAIRTFSQIGEHDKVHKHIQKAESYLEKNQEVYLRNQLTFQKSLAHHYFGRPEEAFRMAQKGRDLAESCGDVSSLFLVNWFLCMQAFELGKIKDAKQYLHQAQRTLQGELDLGFQLRLQQLHASILLAQGDLQTAQRIYQKVLHSRASWPYSPSFLSRQLEQARQLESQEYTDLQTELLITTKAWVASLADFPKYQSTFIHRPQIAAILTDTATQHSIRLPYANSPLGKRLQESDYCTVHWTVEGIEDPMIQKEKGKVGLRRHRILRMVNEAQTQGAACTDQALSETLGVSVRTIERDMQALQKLGHALFTRGQK